MKPLTRPFFKIFKEELITRSKLFLELSRKDPMIYMGISMTGFTWLHALKGVMP